MPSDFANLNNGKKSYLVWRALLWSIWILNVSDTSLLLNLYFVSSKPSNLDKSCSVIWKFVNSFRNHSMGRIRLFFSGSRAINLLSPMIFVKMKFFCFLNIPYFIKSRGNKDLVSSCIVPCNALMLRLQNSLTRCSYSLWKGFNP